MAEGRRAAARVGARRLEVKWTNQVGVWVAQRDSFRPCDKFGRIRRSIREEQIAWPVINNVARVEGEGVPFRPPSGGNVGLIAIGGVAGVKVAEMDTCMNIAKRVGGGQVTINRDEVPASA